MEQARTLRSIRIWLPLFIIGLVLRGATAFPLEHETDWLCSLLANHSLLPQGTVLWIDRVHSALRNTDNRYPFLAYGTDWLAFAHLVIAVAFLGPLNDPVRNKWVLQFGLIACAAVIPLALIAGPIRGIPLAWRLIDCSFGVIAAIPLVIAVAQTNRLERRFVSTMQHV